MVHSLGLNTPIVRMLALALHLLSWAALGVCDMSGKFWRKCGKLISENGVPVRCKSSPCGFFAVVGIKYRALDCDTLAPINECSWQYETNVYNIKQGYITWQG